MATPKTKIGTGSPNWIAKMHLKKGALHRALGIPEGQKIPADKLAAATKSTSPRIRRMAALAGTLKSFN